MLLKIRWLHDCFQIQELCSRPGRWPVDGGAGGVLASSFLLVHFKLMAQIENMEKKKMLVIESRKMC